MYDFDKVLTQEYLLFHDDDPPGERKILDKGLKDRMIQEIKEKSLTLDYLL
jgi:hypothetical protein